MISFFFLKKLSYMIPIKNSTMKLLHGNIDDIEFLVIQNLNLISIIYPFAEYILTVFFWLSSWKHKMLQWILDCNLHKVLLIHANNTSSIPFNIQYSYIWTKIGIQYTMRELLQHHHHEQVCLRSSPTYNAKPRNISSESTWICISSQSLGFNH
jgi:hypothetical protein